MTNLAHAQYRQECERVRADYFFDKCTEFDQIPLALEHVHLGLRAVPAQPGE